MTATPEMTTVLTPKEKEQMVKAGMHLGHEPEKWNENETFIYTEKNNIHIIDLIDTYSRLRGL
jgi:ribosomal protein S2